MAHRDRPHSDRGYTWDVVLVDVRCNQFDYVMQCSIHSNKCTGHTLSPDGRYIAYKETTISDSNDDVTYLMIYDAQTQIHERIYQVDAYNPFGCAVCQQWIGDEDLLVFRPFQDEDKLIIYNVEENRISEIVSLDVNGSFYFSLDGTHYAHYDYDTQAPPFAIVQHPDNRVEVILRYRMWDGTSSSGYSRGHEWHPNYEYILINDRFYSNPTELNLYNMVTEEIETIASRDYYDSFSSATFNYDGSQILYSVYLQGTVGLHQIMLYDMETREEIPLPLFGTNPQWVNGGR